MEAFVFIPILIGLVIWIWFAFTLNGIHSQLKKLNKNAEKQLVALGFAEDLDESESTTTGDLFMYCPKCKSSYELKDNKDGKCPECRSRMDVSRR
jgi:predicted Zn-ribbon and HTH transcriptional regulator